MFVLFGGLALAAGLGMIFQRNAVHGALLLVLNFFAVSVLFLTLGAEFLMAAQIVVYAGAIMVLFLFVIMLLGVDRAESLSEPRPMQRRQGAAGAVAAAVLFVAIAASLSGRALEEGFADAPANFGSAASLGAALFSTYLLPFEVTSLLLLVAAIGILMLAKRTPP